MAVEAITACRVLAMSFFNRFVRPRASFCNATSRTLMPSNVCAISFCNWWLIALRSSSCAARIRCVSKRKRF